MLSSNHSTRVESSAHGMTNTAAALAAIVLVMFVGSIAVDRMVGAYLNHLGCHQMWCFMGSKPKYKNQKKCGYLSLGLHLSMSVLRED